MSTFSEHVKVCLKVLYATLKPIRKHGSYRKKKKKIQKNTWVYNHLNLLLPNAMNASTDATPQLSVK